VDCVQSAAGQLQKDGFFTEKTALWYVETARKIDLKTQGSTR
jgi:hypothetical protein